MRIRLTVPLLCVASIALLATCGDPTGVPRSPFATSLSAGLLDEVPATCHAGTQATLVADETVPVGTVTVSNDGVKLYVRFATSAAWPLRKTALAVGASVEDIPTTGSGNPRIGRFPHSNRHPDGTTEAVYEVPLSAIAASDAVVAAFAEVGPDAEGAWAAGEELSSGGNWATVMMHEIRPCVTQRVGSTGGTIQFENVTLEVPAGALTQEVVLTVAPIPLSAIEPSIPTSDAVAAAAAAPTSAPLASSAMVINGVFVLGGTAYQLGPEGLQFQQPVKVTIGYDDADLPAGVPERLLRVFVINGVFFDPGPDPAMVDEANDRVSVLTMHFSEFVVGGPSHIADLEVAMTVAPDPVEVDGDLVHTITVTNHGPDDATDVRVGLVVDGDVDIASPNQEGCTDLFSVSPPRKLLVDCPAGDLASGASATLTLTVVPNVAGETLTSTARIDDFDDAEDADASNDEVVEQTVVAGAGPTLQGDLQIAMTVLPDPAAVGGDLIHTITVTNLGPNTPATDITISLRVEGDVLITSPSQEGCTDRTSASPPEKLLIDCPVLPLSLNDSDELTLVLVPQTPGQQLTSTATIESFTGPADPDLTNNSVSTTTVVSASAFTGTVAFISERDGSPELYVRDLASGTVTQLTNTDDIKGRPAISPDGSRIVFTRQSLPGSPSNLWLIGSDGTGLTQLTNQLDTRGNARWSPDGQEIVYQDASDGDWELYVLEVANPANVRKLTDNSAQDLEPDWSPDGSSIVYHRASTGGGALRRLSAADGSGDVQLAAVAGRRPRWSPDGTRVAFSRGVASNGARVLEAVTVATGAVSTLLADGLANDSPDWSPSGLHLVFARNDLDPGLFDDVFDLWVVSADGTGSAVALEVTASQDTSPDWR